MMHATKQLNNYGKYIADTVHFILMTTDSALCHYYAVLRFNMIHYSNLYSTSG